MCPLALLAFLAALAVSARASVCAAAPGTKTAKPRWMLDHYVYDASLQQDWAVLVDCNHPSAPARMRAAASAIEGIHAKRAATQHGRTLPAAAPIRIQAGAAVEVSNGAREAASIHLAGTAMETAFVGQPIRVRLSAGGNFVRAVVRGPHTVELAAASKPSWEQP